MGRIVDRRRVMGKKGLLPSGYTQLEYIENTSTAYIETDYYGTCGDEVEIIYKSNHRGSYFVIGWGDFDEDGSYNRHYGAFISDHVQLAHNTTYNNYYLDVQNKHTYLYKVENNVPYTLVDGVVKMVSTTTGSRPDKHTRFDIFACRSWPSYKNTYAKGRCYSFTVKRDDVEIYHLIPCISKDSVVGLYDIINRKFYSSPNGVAFIAGPVVNK